MQSEFDSRAPLFMNHVNHVLPVGALHGRPVRHQRLPHPGRTGHQCEDHSEQDDRVSTSPLTARHDVDHSPVSPDLKPGCSSTQRWSGLLFCGADRWSHSGEMSAQSQWKSPSRSQPGNCLITLVINHITFISHLYWKIVMENELINVCVCVFVPSPGDLSWIELPLENKAKGEFCLCLCCVVFVFMYVFSTAYYWQTQVLCFRCITD